MIPINRRQSLQSLLSVAMAASAVATLGYINREELAKWIPAPRRPEWRPWAMILTTVHPGGITKDQATAINSTKVKIACDKAGIGYTKAQYSDDLTAKGKQFQEMRAMLEETGPYSVITVSNRGYIRTSNAPADLDAMIKLIEGVN